MNNKLINILSLIFLLFALLSQTFHTFHTLEILSDINNNTTRNIHSLIYSIACSGGLFIFTIYAGYNRRKKYNSALSVFRWFETCINIFYYCHRFIYVATIQKYGYFVASDIDYYHLITSLPFAIMLPYIIRKFAGEINFRVFNNKKKR